jgi:uncharacterized protein
MSRFFGFVFAACLLATGTSASAQATHPPDWPKSLTLASGSPGGTFYIYAEAMAKILSESLKIEVNDLPTGGSEHNVKLVESGGAQLGLLTMGTGLQGWNGTGDWTSGQRYRKMRALFPMYDQPFQFVTLRRSGITTVAQFNNRNVGTGPRAGVQSFYVPAILAAIGVSAKISYGSWDSAANDLLGGRYDAFVAFTGGRGAPGGHPWPRPPRVHHQSEPDGSCWLLLRCSARAHLGSPSARVTEKARFRPSIGPCSGIGRSPLEKQRPSHPTSA